MTGARQSLGGWGNFPRMACTVRRPDTVAALQREVASPASHALIARGLGRSYGDSSLLSDGVVLDQSVRRRFLEFDREEGMVHCEAGVSLADMIDVCLPCGWFLPTTPGTKFVTLGGAIAADVHGKNHHVDGSFGQWVSELTMLLPCGDVVVCGPDRDAELFWATVGGMGLTGIILSARVRLHRKRSAFCEQTLVRTRTLEETLSLMSAEDCRYRYSVAWVDCLARGKSLGRSIVMLANDAEPESLPPHLAAEPLGRVSRFSLGVPVTPPVSVVRRSSVRGFNAIYYRMHRQGSALVDYESFFYPLDGIAHWNRLYGPRGFIQYQALFPLDTASDGLRELLDLVSSGGNASFLAVLKRSGPASPGILSFLDRGYTLAVDVPHPGSRLRELAAALDRVVLRHGGRVYLAKDSTTSAEAFMEMYPSLARFRSVKARIDPETRFSSAQARRLRIMDGA